MYFGRSLIPCSFLLALALPARAEVPLRVHGTAAAARALNGHQQDEFGWGVGVLPALEYSLTGAIGIQLEPSFVWLSEGEPPRDPNIAPEGSGKAFGAGAGVRLRPFVGSHDTGLLTPAGFWLSAAGGIVTTHKLARPMFDVELGYDFLDARGNTGLGPMVGLYHVFQPNDELRPADANLLLVGVHGLLDLGPRLRERGDRDFDGLFDDEDQCVEVPEDKDGFEDTDGCPDLDDDKDGIPDAKDRCSREPEDKDGFEDADGCPDPDNDEDGILDKADKCPLVAEDKDGFDDTDGCPDFDDDNDGIADKEDLCPLEPETVNDYADEDGCPDEEQVRVVGDRIVLDDRVHFLKNVHIIRSVSFGLLNNLAKLIKDHPEYVHISIEGHADERGPESLNQPLSELRAQSVMNYLVRMGIPRSRLSTVGHGEQKPLSAAPGEAGYRENRRVEFIITRQSKLSPREAPPPVPEPLGTDLGPMTKLPAPQSAPPPPPRPPTPPKPQSGAAGTPARAPKGAE